MNTDMVHSGDDGDTEILSGKNISKDDLRIETLGELDEIQSILGILRSIIKQKRTKEILFRIQNDLQLVMGEIASEKQNPSNTQKVDDNFLLKLEESIQNYQKQDEPQKGFIIPGDDFISAMVDQARTVARRAERRVVAAYRGKLILNKSILKYMNRLSTLLYYMEIHEMKLAKNQQPKQAHIA